MAAPKVDLHYWKRRNPDATEDLIIPLLVFCNTSDEQIAANVRTNTSRDVPWLMQKPEHDGVAVIVGGGPSVADHIYDIARLFGGGAHVFAINNASRYLRYHGITPDWQVTCDAKKETSTLVDPDARGHLFASQVDPETLAAAPNPTLWHLETGDVEQHFPAERVKRGGYALIGGGASSGNSALCLAYCMGYRTIHVFGFDSSNRGEASHAYDQPMNFGIPIVEVTWAGMTYQASVAMKAQAEKFMITGQALQQLGCAIHVHGDGLLPTMWRTPAASLSERDIYRRMWMNDDYRTVAPGEYMVPGIAEFCKLGPIIDFGCGTGRAAVKLTELGFEVILVDFADNCRDDEALGLPFLEWDLSRPCPLRAPYGYCCDVMEHIPPDQVDAVLTNLREACSEGVFFRIEHEADVFGPAVLGRALHLSVHGPEWWKAKLEQFWPRVESIGGGIFLACASSVKPKRIR
jgi:uncharacterized Rossmann fold enzyme